MTTATHTPGPWAINHTGMIIIDVAGDWLADTRTVQRGIEEDKANARRIKTACNAHDQLAAENAALRADLSDARSNWEAGAEELRQAIEYEPGEWFNARTLDEMQAFYMSRLPAIRKAAEEHGYAIGLHGSTRRDFDLMAMQWRADASDKDALAHAIAVAACGITRDCAYQWEQKPSGRFSVSLPICWTDHSNPDFDNKPSIGHIDLSVIDHRSPAANAGGQAGPRAEFETCNKLKDFNFFRDSKGAYISAATRGGWKAWQAARPAAVGATGMASNSPELDGIEMAAKFIDKKAEKYIRENASTESDTGAVAWHYGDEGRDHYSTLVELAEEIRVLLPRRTANGAAGATP